MLKRRDRDVLYFVRLIIMSGLTVGTFLRYDWFLALVVGFIFLTLECHTFVHGYLESYTNLVLSCLKGHTHDENNENSENYFKDN